MILVITGTEVHPFDRLLKHVDGLVESGQITEEVFVQRGHTPYEPKHCKWEKLISFGEMSDKVRSASVIVTHAGAGTTLLCMQFKRQPIIVPRFKKFGEQIDDHQLPFARKLDEFGLVRTVWEIEDLAEAIDAARGRVVEQKTSQASKIVSFLEGYWQDLAAKQSSAGRTPR